MKATVTAIIPTMLNDSGLFYLVEKLARDEIPTVVIDNQPNPKKRQLAKKPNLTYLPQNKNLGFAAAVNLGAKTAKTDWLLILNDDIELPKLSPRGWRRLPRGDNFKQLLVALISFAQKNKLVAVSPALVNKQGKVENYGYRVLPYGKVELNFDPKNTNIDGLTAACLLIRRDIFLKVGGFDKRFFAYLEDVDLFLTLKEQKYRFANHPKLSVIHNHLTTSSKLKRGFKQWHDFKNWILLKTKHQTKFKLSYNFIFERLKNFIGIIRILTKDKFSENSKKTEPVIHICLATDNNYSQHCQVVIASALLNSNRNDKLFFHIIDGGISQTNIHKILNLKKLKSCMIEFVKINKKDFEGFPVPKSAPFNIVGYYRIKASTIFKKIHKIIYLDSDTVVKKSLSDLYNININDYHVAAAKTQTSELNKKRLGLPRNSVYICSGVMLINLNKWREDRIESKLINYIRNNKLDKLSNIDQDAINGVLYKSIKLISQNWEAEYRTDLIPTIEYSKVLKNPYIIHYLAYDKPWHKFTKQNSLEYLFYLKVVKKLDNE